MDFDSMTKEELISYIKFLESKRAFTHEDRLLLEIIDKTPFFTVWASDKNCIVKLWAGQCQARYAYTKEQMIGQDFVSKFVAPHEQAAARRDQLQIIDKGERFHNIANDHGGNGTTMRLMTFCYRIQDPDTGEMLNAEMGVDVSSYDAERQILEENIAESKKIQSFIESFNTEINQCEQQYEKRILAVSSELMSKKLVAAQQGKLVMYNLYAEETVAKIDSAQDKANEDFSDYRNKIAKLVTYQACQDLRVEFERWFDRLLRKLDELLIDFKVFCVTKLDGDESLFFAKDTVLRATTQKDRELRKKADKILEQVTSKYQDYRTTFSPGKNDAELVKMSRCIESINIIIKEIERLSDDIYNKIAGSNSRDEVEEIKHEMEIKFAEIEKKISEIENI